jgi:hypothetical protein
MAVLYHVVYPLWPPGLLRYPIPFRLYFAQAGIEAGIGNEPAAAPMIGVTVGNGIGYHYLRTIMAYVSDQLLLVCFIIFKEAIGHARILTHFYAHYDCGILRLLQAQGSAAPGTQFALCKVYNAYVLASQRMFYQRTGAA